MKKLLAILLASLMVLAMVACSGNAPAATTEPKTDDAPTKVESDTATDAAAELPKSYQLVGEYIPRSDDQASSIGRYAGVYLLNLVEDGTAHFDRYQYLNHDESDFASNPDYTKDFMTGTWERKEIDGIDCIRVALHAVDENGKECNQYSGRAYENDDGSWTIEQVDFPIVIGMSFSRFVKVDGGADKAYADENALIKAFANKYADAEALIAASGVAVGENVDMSGTEGLVEPEKETDEPEKEAEAPAGHPENTLLLVFTPDASDQLKMEFYKEKSSDWAMALGAAGSYTPTDSTDVLMTWDDDSENAELTFLANGTYVYKFTSYNIEETGTWVYDHYKVTTTTAKGLVAESEIVKSAAAEPAAEAKAEETKTEETAATTEAAATTGCIWAGEYDLTVINQDGQESSVDTFEIDEEGNVSGAVEDSGMSGFEGKIDANGHFECEMPRLGGTMTGDIDKNGHLTATSEARGRTSTLEGDIIGGMPAAADDAASTDWNGDCPFAGEYDITYRDGDPFDTFEIDENGVVSGAVEDSGMSGFEGKIDANGHFECEMTRLGGTMSGDITADGHVTGSADARGMNITFEGDKF